MHSRSMQNPLIHSIHQSISVVVDKFLELAAEESGIENTFPNFKIYQKVIKTFQRVLLIG